MVKKYKSLAITFLIATLFLNINFGGQTAQAELDKLIRWSPRAYHSTVLLPNGSIILMGGRGYGEKDHFADVWRSRSDDPSIWERVNAHAEWGPRFNHESLLLSDGSIIIMGGNRFNSDGELVFLNDVWQSYDQGRSWQRATHSAGWSPRVRFASLVTSGGDIIISGGESIGGGGQFNREFHADIWRSSDKGQTWSEIINPSHTDWYSARSGHHILALADDSILLLGGHSFDEEATRQFSDIWRSQDGGASWAIVSGSELEQVTSFNSLLQADGKIVSLGGSVFTVERPPWYLRAWNWITGQSEKNRKLSGSAINSVFSSSDQGLSWQQEETVGELWSERSGHSSVVHPDGSIVVIGGTTNEGFTNDVWQGIPLPGNTVEWKEVAPPPDYVGRDYEFFNPEPERPEGYTVVYLHHEKEQNLMAWFMDKSGYNIMSFIYLSHQINAEERIAAVGDINKDGTSDLVVENTLNGEKSVWLMKDDGVTRIDRVNLGPSRKEPKWNIAGVENVLGTGDGYPQIILENNVEGHRGLWVMGGFAGTESKATKRFAPIAVNPDYKIAALADLNGNGIKDIIFENHQTGQRYIWLMNAQGNVRKKIAGMIDKGSEWRIRGATDVTGDFFDELYAQNINTGACELWLLDVFENEDENAEYPWVAELTQSFPLNHGSMDSDWVIVGVSRFYGTPSGSTNLPTTPVRKGDLSVDVIADQESPQEPGAEINIIASSEDIDTPEYRFHLRGPESSEWTVVQDYDTADTYLWTPTLEGTYRFSVWARHSGSTAEYEAYNTDLFFTIAAEEDQEYRVDSLKVSTDRNSPREPGETITVTASSTGSPTPEYRFYIRAPQSTDWQMVRDYSADSSYRWRPTVEGTYRFSVWARHSGSTAEYEVFNTDFYFTIASVKEPEKPDPDPDPVIEFSVILTPDMNSPQAVGEAITFKAESTGFTKPLYSFWVEENKKWHKIQDYSTKAWCLWTPKEADFYQIKVWVKNSGTAAEFEAEDLMPYQVTEVIKPPNFIFEPVF